MPGARLNTGAFDNGYRHNVQFISKALDDSAQKGKVQISS